MSLFSILFLLILLVCICQNLALPTVFQKFKKTYWGRKGTVLREVNGINSVGKCSFLCSPPGGSGDADCSGFHFDSEGQTCKLLTGIIPGVAFNNVNDLDNDVVYRGGGQCPASIGYELVSAGPYQFCLSLKLEEKTYNSARASCNEDGGNLADLKFHEKYDAFLSLILKAGSTGSRTWTGVTDELVEGQFVSEEDGKAMVDPLRWEATQPNNWGGTQDYLDFQDKKEVTDTDVTGKMKYICEIQI